ncbi:hypothetical protein B566_EDAN008719 [Ephemera danica]|nr:hypothetical protein B566_EDAN008719 [Ephemera danica]
MVDKTLTRWAGVGHGVVELIAAIKVRATRLVLVQRAWRQHGAIWTSFTNVGPCIKISSQNKLKLNLRLTIPVTITKMKFLVFATVLVLCVAAVFATEGRAKSPACLIIPSATGTCRASLPRYTYDAVS